MNVSFVRCCASLTIVLGVGLLGCETASRLSVGEVHYNEAETESQRPPVFDLGEIPCGGYMQRAFKLENNSKSDWLLAEFKTSCECIAVKTDSTCVRAGQASDVIISADLSKDVTFEGGLRVRVECHGAMGNVLHEFDVDLSVKSCPG